MAEWKVIKTLADIPPIEDWDKYEWEGKFVFDGWHKMAAPTQIGITSGGAIFVNTSHVWELRYRSKIIVKTEIPE